MALGMDKSTRLLLVCTTTLVVCCSVGAVAMMNEVYPGELVAEHMEGFALVRHDREETSTAYAFSFSETTGRAAGFYRQPCGAVIKAIVINYGPKSGFRDDTVNSDMRKCKLTRQWQKHYRGRRRVSPLAAVSPRTAN